MDESRQPLGSGRDAGPPMVCRRRRPNAGAAAEPTAPPSPSKQSVTRTIDSLGLRIRTIESEASTGSQAEYFKPEQTILIFDWDDTICPSTWIQANRRVLSFFRPVPNDETYQKPLRELQLHAEAVLQQAMQMGSVVIITNAADPWVEISCRNFLPKLLPMVSKLPVVYARSLFYSSLESTIGAAGLGATMPSRRLSAMGTASAGRSSSASPASSSSPGGRHSRAAVAAPGMRQALLAMQQDEVTPQHWKEVAFEQEIAGFYSRYSHQSWKNVVSIGDSVFERDATQQVVMKRPCAKKRCRAKTVKMFDDPTIEELIAQVRLLDELLGALVKYDGDLNIEIDMGDLQEAGLLGIAGA
uniref:Uncharacterized protein n=1 Tax=Alexandrium monilatum TaxID=311494 RepID=A0A7S4RIE9_9DINO|mmetsp:Transcript_81322/g.242346  ORF Transcript_81322/g.242346 Transcript_81322/m.242346 type:complete len:357 (-) Transcript_81322:154-1224(-)